jgi:hypothetical protein
VIQPSAPDPNPYASAPTAPGGGKAIASLCLGLFGLLAWLLPIIGLPTTITGLVLGIKSVSGPRKGMATAGIVLCIIGLVLSIANAAIGAYLGATGQLHYLR